jgi:hypothetical protein
MTIKYYLVSNPISKAVKNFIARVVPNETLDNEEIITKMLKRGTSATEADIRHILTLYFDVATDEVANGNSLTTPLANVRPGMQGTFDSASDTFDRSSHDTKASLSQGLLLEQKMATANVEKISAPAVSPLLVEYLDAKSKTSNSVLTPGSIGTLTGTDLKFNTSNVKEGVFFLDEAGAETKADVYSDVYDTEVKFVVPALATGIYSVELRKAYTKDNVIRRDSLDDNLTVG